VFNGLQPKITSSMANLLDHPLMLEELSTTLKNMASTKSPSPNIVLTELYKSLWPAIGPEFLSMLQADIATGALHQCVIEGLIVLLHKGGGHNIFNNWSPITLLNVSYKLFAKALQMRLQPVLMEIIFVDQSAFLPMRYILDNIFFTKRL
jgi:hypothetical protein